MGKGSGACASRPGLSLSASPSRAPIDGLGARIRAALTPDLLKPEYRAATRPYAGHCYVSAEAYFHLAGGKAAGWTPVTIRHEGSPHWFLRGADGRIVDLTAEQFETPVPYELGRGAGFLTREPSRRARVVIERVRPAE